MLVRIRRAHKSKDPGEACFEFPYFIESLLMNGAVKNVCVREGQTRYNGSYKSELLSPLQIVCLRECREFWRLFGMKTYIVVLYTSILK